MAHAGALLAAGTYFRQLLECANQQPATTQATYLREYLYVAQCAAEAAAAAAVAERGNVGDVSGNEDRVAETEAGVGAAAASSADVGTDAVAAVLQSGADEGLPLPAIDVGDVHVHFQDGHSSSSNSASCSSGGGGGAVAGDSAESSPSAGASTFVPPCASWPDSRWSALEAGGAVISHHTYFFSSHRTCSSLLEA